MDLLKKILYIVPNVLAILGITLYFFILTFMNITGEIGILMILLLLFAVVSGLVAGGVNIYTLVHVCQNKEFNNNKKIVWVALIATLGMFASPIYAFKYIFKVKNFPLAVIIYSVIMGFLYILYIATMVFSNFSEDFLVSKQTGKTKDNLVEITINDNYEIKDVGEYDFYAIDEENNMLIGLFTYDKDSYEFLNAEDILYTQLNYFKETRDDYVFLKEYDELKSDDKTINSVSFKGKYNNSDNCTYKLTTIEFSSRDDYVVLAIQITLSEDFYEQEESLKEVIDSIKLLDKGKF